FHIVEVTINHIEVLQHQLLPQIRDWYGDRCWIFQQHSAQCHMVISVKTWCAQNGIELFPWGGNFPDMNPIESIVCFEGQKYMKFPLCTIKVQLRECLIKVWYHSARIKKLCKTLIVVMPTHVS
ncbi:hypothetical protein OTU49_016436, partial [Cherax quadricarinatus]